MLIPKRSVARPLAPPSAGAGVPTALRPFVEALAELLVADYLRNRKPEPRQPRQTQPALLPEESDAR